MDAEQKKGLVKKFLEQGILLSPDTEGFSESSTSPFAQLAHDVCYLNNDISSLLTLVSKEVNWREFEKARAYFEKHRTEKLYEKFLEYLRQPKSSSVGNVKVISSWAESSSKKEVSDFVMYFNIRFEALRKLLYARSELKNTSSISRILAKKEKENISLIGMVVEKETTKNGNIMIVVEDTTGQIKVMVSKDKPELFQSAQELVPDEVIGVQGVNGNNVIFANSIIWPDIPVTNEMKKSNEEAYAVFISDLHIGSNHFLSEDFQRFLDWINQRAGSETQRSLASKVRYIFVIGDLVDGVGIYPGQENDLAIQDVHEQYKECTKLLSQIPSTIPLIICPGNHDALRLAEPQPPLYSDFSGGLYQLPNTFLVSNPSVINIHSDDTFQGYTVLMYHGCSFDHYVANVDTIRNKGGYDRADLIMKFLLKRRHLAPTHTSTIYSPFSTQDSLLIESVPDFFVSGHIHKFAASNYRGVTMICASCWQSTTPFQEKVGHHPEPSRVPIVNLATRELKVLRFGK